MQCGRCRSGFGRGSPAPDRASYVCATHKCDCAVGVEVRSFRLPRNERGNGGGGGSRIRRDDDANPRGSADLDGNVKAVDSSMAPKLPNEVAKACYALALAVLDGDQDLARRLARSVLNAAIDRAAGQV